MSKSKLCPDAVGKRHSVRNFLPTPLPDALLQAILEEAQCAPSNYDIQPWQVHIVSGVHRDALSKALLDADSAGRMTADSSFDLRDFYDVSGECSKVQGAAYHQAIGVAREATEDRRTAARLNLDFFGAPHVALLFMPSFGDNGRVAGDVGMYGQTFLLSLMAHGLGGIPQTMLGFYADTIREVLGIHPSMKMLFGISFGYPNTAHAANRCLIEKPPIKDSVVFHG